MLVTRNNTGDVANKQKHLYNVGVCMYCQLLISSVHDDMLMCTQTSLEDQTEACQPAPVIETREIGQ